MPKIEFIQKLEEMESHAELVESADNSDSAILLSETATREICHALDEHLDRISPYESDEQERLSHLYDTMMERFKFDRGSYILTSESTLLLRDELMTSYTPQNQDAWDVVLQTFEKAEN